MASTLQMDFVLDSKEYDLFIRSIKINIRRRNAILITARKVSAEFTAKRFRDGGQAPHRWPALADATIQARIRRGTWPGAGGSQPILQELGNLRDSLVKEGLPGSYVRSFGKDQVEFGTTDARANILQKGSQRMNLPSRPMLYWSKKEVDAISSFALSFIVNEKRAFIPGGLFP